MKKRGNIIIETARERRENNRKISVIVSKIDSYLDTGDINILLVYNHIMLLINAYGRSIALKRIGEKMKRVEGYDVLNAFLKAMRGPLFLSDNYDKDLYNRIIKERR